MAQIFQATLRIVMIYEEIDKHGLDQYPDSFDEIPVEYKKIIFDHAYASLQEILHICAPEMLLTPVTADDKTGNIVCQITGPKKIDIHSLLELCNFEILEIPYRDIAVIINFVTPVIGVAPDRDKYNSQLTNIADMKLVDNIKNTNNPMQTNHMEREICI